MKLTRKSERHGIGPSPQLEFETKGELRPCIGMPALLGDDHDEVESPPPVPAALLC